MNVVRLLIAVSLAMAGASSHAAIEFYTSFAAFDADAGALYSLAGFEDFDDNTLSPGQVSIFGSPLSLSDPAVSGTFPSGAGAPVEFVSSPTLRVAKDTALTPNTVLGNANSPSSLRLDLDPLDGIKALSFNLLAPTIDVAQSVRLDVLVTLLGGATDSRPLSPIGPDGLFEFGLTTDPFDAPIESVRLSAATLNGTVSSTRLFAIDNLSLFASAPIIPEPATGLVGLVLTAAGGLILRSRIGD
ncbi:hypothetical protein [Botrimarina sp.]|uniref:hypothetical protein n=1 Tax=Botrimarina sp. TaxID=2795802 RepID=UPI0032EF4B06